MILIVYYFETANVCQMLIECNYKSVVISDLFYVWRGCKFKQTLFSMEINNDFVMDSSQLFVIFGLNLLLSVSFFMFVVVMVCIVMQC